ncbi:hypothetical protein L6452_08089 [Arctium lappa]|uniref:Uncharacterized protein n=1 Tax=Arctium lappa TaxID=4217 RepID=A0ACB9DGR8_ARCLA|nr:hypothetical protein L6452_08089 [Arctium lappa]
MSRSRGEEMSRYGCRDCARDCAKGTIAWALSRAVFRRPNSHLMPFLGFRVTLSRSKGGSLNPIHSSGSVWYADKIGLDWTGQNWTGQDKRLGQDWTRQMAVLCLRRVKIKDDGWPVKDDSCEEASVTAAAMGGGDWWRWRWVVEEVVVVVKEEVEVVDDGWL